MDIRLIRHDKIDDKKWDRCIRNSVNGTLYAYSWYLNMVSEQWEALVDGDYECVFPLPYRTRGGIKYAFMPPFTQQLGLFSAQHIEARRVEKFLDAIPKEYRLADINLNTLNKVERQDWVTRINRNYELDLISAYEKLREAYSTNTRRNIAKAEKARLSFLEYVSPAEVIQLFRDNRGKDVPNLRTADYQKLERLLHSMMHKGQLHVSGAIGGPNILLAALVVAEVPKRSVLIFSATERMDENYGALAWLIDKYIQSKSNKEVVLDFEGSNHPGLARFYRGFGAKETAYTSVHINRLTPVYRYALGLFREMRGLFRNFHA